MPIPSCHEKETQGYSQPLARQSLKATGEPKFEVAPTLESKCETGAVRRRAVRAVRLKLRPGGTRPCARGHVLAT